MGETTDTKDRDEIKEICRLIVEVIEPFRREYPSIVCQHCEALDSPKYVEIYTKAKTLLDRLDKN